MNPRPADEESSRRRSLPEPVTAVTDTAGDWLPARMAEVEVLRAEGKPTLPTNIGIELKTNPFLRAADPTIRKNLGMESATDAEVFTEIRERKNRG